MTPFLSSSLGGNHVTRIDVLFFLGNLMFVGPLIGSVNKYIKELMIPAID